ncbi:acylphosphatase-2 [Anopheles moucheti]|uniref:acylphosphatase n=1 Tax=Anopheles minimus TaxID=112268 RepID=A0A182W6M5_9DIPT|nr:acylphosphatase-2 [Anopheles moucheti]XP_053664540.1 acylphosphatase-2 [Anopheles marshallii]
MGVQDLQDHVLVQCDFEIFGQVQGCGFTKHCRDNCLALSIKGWVKNSKQGTIMGKMQGAKGDVGKMVDWLSKTGSPGCKIDKAEFTNWGTCSRLAFTDFAIRF